jgi:hypothetical protein
MPEPQGQSPIYSALPRSGRRHGHPGSGASPRRAMFLGKSSQSETSRLARLRATLPDRAPHFKKSDRPDPAGLQLNFGILANS